MDVTMYLSEGKETTEVKKVNRNVSKLKHFKHEHLTTGRMADVLWNEASCRTNDVEQPVQPWV